MGARWCCGVPPAAAGCRRRSLMWSTGRLVRGGGPCDGLSQDLLSDPVVCWLRPDLVVLRPGLRGRDPTAFRQPGCCVGAVAPRLRLAGPPLPVGPPADGLPHLRGGRGHPIRSSRGIAADGHGLGAAAGAVRPGPPPTAPRSRAAAPGVPDRRGAREGRGVAGGDRGRELRRTVKETTSMSTAPEAFWIDRDYDREYASDGISRYGAYLRDATFRPWTDHDQAVEWAVFAWERATGPVMSPG